METNTVAIDLIEDSLTLHMAALDSLRHNIHAVVESSKTIVDCLKKGGKVIACGNGGSASDAQHFVAELVGRFVSDRPPLAAVALTTDTSILTAVANDYSFEEIFSRQVEGLCRHGDVLVAISTSGRSKNIINAMSSAKKRGGIVILVSGKDGGDAKPLADISIIIESYNTAAIQEMHIMVFHMICGIIDEQYGKFILNSNNG